MHIHVASSCFCLTICLFKLSADNLCKQFVGQTAGPYMNPKFWHSDHIHLLITLVNSFGQDQVHNFVTPDLDPNFCWTCRMHRHVAFSHFCITLYLLMSSADNLCKQFEPRSGSTYCWRWSESKLLTLLSHSSADNLSKQFVSRLGSTFWHAWSGFELFDILPLPPQQARGPFASDLYPMASWGRSVLPSVKYVDD